VNQVASVNRLIARVPVPCVDSLKLTDQVVLTGALSYLLMLMSGLRDSWQRLPPGG
jgi:hypothetical protein